MPNQRARADLNNFVGGLNSDASPLNFPPNTSLDEDNFVLNKDGSRQRRLGMDYETDFVENTATSGKISDPTPGMVFNTFKWDGVAGIAGKSFLAVQAGGQVDIYDLDVDPLSSSKLFTAVLGFTTTYAGVGDFDNFNKLFSFTSIKGKLIIANRSGDITSLTYDEGTNTLSSETFRLKIRDHFGLPKTVTTSGTDFNLRSGNGVTHRYESSAYTDRSEIIYNLRNQSWVAVRPNANDETLTDPIKAYVDAQTALGASGTKLPSHADTVNQSLFTDTSDTDDRTLTRFFPDDLIKNPRGTTHAPTGHFIIDALERGASRLAAIEAAQIEYPATVYFPWGTSSDPTSNWTVPDDITPTGASAVEEFSGRLFYSGFDTTTIDGDSKSPSLGSYLLFSRLIRDTEDFGICYQDSDPTSTEDPNIVATDGGFVPISGAYGVHTLRSIGNSLIIIAENGVWRLVGGTDVGFAATGYIVEKISDKGSKAPGSEVVIDSTLIYWAPDGIRHVKPNEQGSYVSESLTSGRLQNFYNNIPEEDINVSKGVYDSVENKVRWVYGTRIEEEETETRELVLDLNISAYYTNTLTKVGDTKLVSIFKDNPFKLSTAISDVIDIAGDKVIDLAGDQVVVTSTSRASVTKEVGYVVVTETTPIVKYTFCSYTDINFVDWLSEDSTGIDAAAFLITGYATGDELQSRKQIPNLLFKLRRTETGFTVSGEDLIPRNASSCLVQVQWGWTNSAAAGRWSREFQAYKYKRHYFAANAADLYDTGDLIIETKHRPRGSGKSMSLYIRTEAAKDLHLYGWSLALQVNSNV